MLLIGTLSVAPMGLEMGEGDPKTQTELSEVEVLREAWTSASPTALHVPRHPSVPLGSRAPELPSPRLLTQSSGRALRQPRGPWGAGCTAARADHRQSCLAGSGAPGTSASITRVPRLE